MVKNLTNQCISQLNLYINIAIMVILMSEEKPINAMYGQKVKLDLDKLKSRSKSENDEITEEQVVEDIQSESSNSYSSSQNSIREEDKVTSDGWNPNEHEVSRESIDNGYEKVRYDDDYFRVVDKDGNIITYGYGG